MEYQNAKKGLSLLFIGELLGLIGSAVMLIALAVVFFQKHGQRRSGFLLAEAVHHQFLWLHA